MRNDAIDRWFRFPYAWTPSIVEAALEVVDLDSVGVLWDPFVGSGTTALIGALRGIATISSDIDPLATLITSLKLAPPRVSEIEWARKTIEELDLDVENIPSVLDSADKRRADILRFFIAVPLLRARWHEGINCDSHCFMAQLETLIEEILEDSPQILGLTPTHSVSCLDFYASAKSISECGRTPIALMTSPPFPTSNVNPDIERLTSVLGMKRPQGNLISECLQPLECVAIQLSAVAESYRNVLRTVVDSAIRIGCPAVVLEIASLKPMKVEPFVESTRKQLSEHGYVVQKAFDASTPLEEIIVLPAMVDK